MNDTENAIADFEHFKKMGYSHSYLPSSWNIEVAITALREKQAREHPEPLTLAQLREMVGEPVYVRHKLFARLDGWYLAMDNAIVRFAADSHRIHLSDYDPLAWDAYAHKPGGEM